MREFGIECDDGHYGPATYDTIFAHTLTEAWVMANRRHAKDGHRVMVVFSLDDTIEQATRLDYSNTTGTGDPH